MNSAILSLPSYSPSFGAVEVLWLKKITMTTENNSQTGGKANGKQLPNSLLKVLSLTIMFLIQEINKEEFNHVNSNNGQPLCNLSISILLEVM